MSISDADDRFMEHLNSALAGALAIDAADMVRYVEEGTNAIEKEGGITAKSVTAITLNGKTTFL